MRGTNKLILNQATINEAVEFYLNSAVFYNAHNVKVSSVQQSSNDLEYTVTLIEPIKGSK